MLGALHHALVKAIAIIFRAADLNRLGIGGVAHEELVGGRLGRAGRTVSRS
jgi:hypothetical protein